MTTTSTTWRFGYGSNLGLRTLREKKNLTVSRYVVGTIQDWELYFMRGWNDYIEPAWAAIRPRKGATLHGVAFQIPQEEAEHLDRQEGGYHVQMVTLTSYEGEVLPHVGLYVPKKPYVEGISREGIPSYRYLKLLKEGAREGQLAQHWIDKLEAVPYYVTPPHIRAQTLQWIAEFQESSEDPLVWSSEKLAQHDGSDPEQFPVHTSIMGFVIRVHPDTWIFPSWKGHNVTRRNLLQFNGKSLDTNDIRYNEPGYRPLPKLDECSEGEKEYLMQSLESQLHKGSKIVAHYEPFL
eukprot:CAMPEP_0195298638 /NCGR_PEP_ID=MMETSP0707-20130614/23942_1 /TAXON_ID=33640 /ORGANISM="Asterionellopsis glacialis, Strain CCMP134" /LENGTH=292 /DNA_ID=CAMNT_0040360825 /DNA_START=145 /DNA_END=1020 /DNA_ORIENTATION=-